jgi:hypothetical protein
MPLCRFWVHPSNWWVVLKSSHLLVGFLFKYECWVTKWIMFSYQFFLGCYLNFCITKFHPYTISKTIHMANFLYEICLIKIQIINFNFFNYYLNEIWKIMQKLIKIKHINIYIYIYINVIKIYYYPKIRDMHEWF